jgi:uncharacterized membrane protein
LREVALHGLFGYSSFLDILTSIEGLIWYVIVLPFGLLGVLRAIKYQRLLPIVAYTALTLLLLATPKIVLGSDHFRGRLMVIPFVFIISAIGLTEYKSLTPERKNLYRYWFAFVGFVFLAFMVGWQIAVSG